MWLAVGSLMFKILIAVLFASLSVPSAYAAPVVYKDLSCQALLSFSRHSLVPKRPLREAIAEALALTDLNSEARQLLESNLSASNIAGIEIRGQDIGEMLTHLETTEQALLKSSSSRGPFKKTEPQNDPLTDIALNPIVYDSMSSRLHTVGVFIQAVIEGLSLLDQKTNFFRSKDPDYVSFKEAIRSVSSSQTTEGVFYYFLRHNGHELTNIVYFDAEANEPVWLYINRVK